MTSSIGPKPIQAEWQQGKFSPQGTMHKEIPGFLSLFHSHCGTSMRRVITFEKSDEGVRRVACNSWICQVCEGREYVSDDC